MHFCTALVAIANDDQQVVARGFYDPISWPEVEVLRQIHGDQSVREVKPFVFVEQTAKAEKERLGLIYGGIVSDKVYTGRTPNMEMDAAELTEVPADTLWLNPLTREVKKVSEAKPELEPETLEDEEYEDDDESKPVSERTLRRRRKRAAEKAAEESEI
jgi:hypothetical protein